MTVTINGLAPSTAQQRDFAAAMGLPVLLQTVTVGSAQQDIDFTGLDMDADKFYRIILIHKPNASEAQGISMYYNGDFNPANYEHQFTQGNNTSITGGRFSNAAVGLGGTPTSTNVGGLTDICLSKFAGATPAANSISSGVITASIYQKTIGHRWISTANVTSIKLRHDFNFGVGTVAKLYKV